MRILRHILLVGTVLVSIAILATAAEPFVLEELHLIHWEELPEGKPSHTGPVSAAILMAWYADHGYPELLPDLNSDGRIDEEDTKLLGRDFGEAMGTRLIDDRLADPFIVYPLARYVAERYPDEFRMLIYDESFPEEVERDLGQPFVPTEVPGILLEVLEDPFYELYIHHLEEQRPGIVGIGHDVPEWNDFTVSRSYIPVEEPDGRPVDLVSTGYEQFTRNPVWETLMRLDPERWGFLMPDWVPFEILVVLLPEDEERGTPRQPGDDPGDDPGDPFDPGNDPGDPFDPGNDPGDPFDPGGGDQPRYPGGGNPGDTPRIPSDDEGVCCLPDGSCDTTTADICAQRGGAFVLGESCATYVCPRPGEALCAKVDGEITDICYTYENGVLRVFASYAITNHSPIAANDITAYALVGLNDGVNGLGGGPECQDWQYGLDIPGNSTHTFDRVFTSSAPNLDLSNLTYLYGALWLQVEAPWDCWPIIEQSFVQTWDPAPLCNPGTPPGGSNDGEPIGACCLPTGQCIETGITDCDTQGGEFRGAGSTCGSTNCSPGSSEGACPALSAAVTEVCYDYRGPNESLLVRATFSIDNFGTAVAQAPWFEAKATYEITEAQTTITYEDTSTGYVPDIPAGGSTSVTHEFNLGLVPREPTDGVLVHVLSRINSPCNDYTETTGTNYSTLRCPNEDDGTGEPGEPSPDPEPQPDPEPDPEPEPEPTLLPNLWVTGMTGCWSWSGGGDEHVIATVTGTVHNGGQTSASNVKARVTAGGKSTTVTVGTIAAGGQKTVSATIDVGAYDTTSWPVSTSITADPLHQVTEADESNNTTNSSFPQSSDCN